LRRRRVVEAAMATGECSHTMTREVDMLPRRERGSQSSHYVRWKTWHVTLVCCWVMVCGCHGFGGGRSSVSVRRSIMRLSSTPESSERAGSSGYSILRRPLAWDAENDPTFAAPTQLDESLEKSSNQVWFQQKQEQKTSNSSGRSSSSDWNQGAASKTHERKDEETQQIDLTQRTLDTLDFPIVLRALADVCDTEPARDMIRRELLSPDDQKALHNKKRKKKKQSSNDESDEEIVSDMPLTAVQVDGVHRRYRAVEELQRLLFLQREAEYSGRKKNDYLYMPPRGGKKRDVRGPPPFGGYSLDMAPIFEIVDKGQVLEGPEIYDIVTALNVLDDLRAWSQALLDLNSEDDNFVELPRLGASIDVNEELKELLENALDDEGRLSGTTFPEIGSLRASVRTLKRDILGTLDELLASPGIQSKLAVESGGALYSEVNGRIVVPVDLKYKNAVGIMHDVSRSGKTAFCEPTEIVGPTNELRQKEVELRSEEARIWRSLTEQVQENQEELEQAIAVAGQLDLVHARVRLGTMVEGVVPHVGDEGIMSLKNARHPVLLLRKLDNVVGSDIDLGANGKCCLVLTGPNSGGKTIILKLMGLVALMARAGIPVPAQSEDARVDFFAPVLADIGDIQSVDGDLSTFSGHMLVCREVLANSKKNALVLMDEVGSGTDPAQGVAIAQALLEALLDTGTRVAITTHYMQLKQLASADDRFAVGGMQFVNGRPTYKLLPGTVGESFALSVAERLNIPSHVIARANELLDSETRQMGDLIQDLEDQKNLVDQQVAELAEKKREMLMLELEMKKQQEKLEQKQLVARRDEARKFAKKLEEKERVLEDILEKLKSDPSRKVVARSWDDVRFVKRDAINEAEALPSIVARKMMAAPPEVELVPLAELRNKPDLNIGDTLMVCKKGMFKGKHGIISEMGNQITLTINGMSARFKYQDLALVPEGFAPSTKSSTSNNNNTGRRKGSILSKRDIQGLEEMGGSAKTSSSNSGGDANKSNTSTMRLDSNTIDVRGSNLEEAKRTSTAFFGRATMSNRSVVYILHGHGTGGVLKQKLRDWLRSERQWVKRYAPADAADGGDAFTLVELKKLKLL